MRPLFFPQEKKRPTLRSRRRRLRVLFLCFAIALMGGAAYGVSYASYLPQFSIQNIEVRGVGEVSESEVRSRAEVVLHNDSYSFISRANIFLYPRAQLEEAIKEYFPRIEGVRVARESLLGTALVVSIQERVAFATWCMVDATLGAKTCYEMDKGGFIFAPVGTSSANSYVFYGALPATSAPVGQRFLPGRFTGIIALLERLGQAGFVPRSVSTEGEQDFSIALAEGYELRASFGADVSGFVRDLELILSSDVLRGKESQLEYIDLRFGNRVYYKFKNSEAVSVE